MFAKGFKKTAGKKKKIKFSPDMNQDDLVKYVKRKADHIMQSGYGSGKPKEYYWHYVPEMPIDFAKKIRSNWDQWFKSETEEWQYNHGTEERKHHFDKWSKEPQLKPVILVKGSKGDLHIWDGHHRIAKAFEMKMKSVPAIIGEKKK